MQFSARAIRHHILQYLLSDLSLRISPPKSPIQPLLFNAGFLNTSSKSAPFSDISVIRNNSFVVPLTTFRRSPPFLIGSGDSFHLTSSKYRQVLHLPWSQQRSLLRTIISILIPDSISVCRLSDILFRQTNCSIIFFKSSKFYTSYRLYYLSIILHILHAYFMNYNI